MVNDPFNFNDFDPFRSDALSPDDAVALDAFFDRERGHGASERVEVVEDLLSLLEHRTAPSVDRSLIDATLARVARARRLGSAEAVLAEGDAAALDALVEAGFNSAALGPAHADRGAAAAALLGALSAGDRPTPSQRESLIAATLARIDASDAERHEKYRLVPELPVLRRRFQMADIVGIAAALLLGVSVIWPMLNEVREQGRRAACGTNLAMVGSAFGQYAGDYADSLPLASASLAGNTWWDVGTQPERSNAANLFTLVRTGYAGLEPLACSASPKMCRTQEAVAQSGMDWRSPDNVSYSYQIQFGRARQARMSQSRGGVLLTDRSPVVVRALRNEPIDPFANSLNHAGIGQNILMADGVVQWITSPVLPSGDNIWLPRSIEMLLNRSREAGQDKQIRGTETPEYQDVFVGP